MEKLSMLSSLSSWNEDKAPVRGHRTLIRMLKNAYQDLKTDLKKSRWKRGFAWFFGVIWFLGLIVSAVYVGVATLTSTSTACQPDGSFRLHPESYTLWSSSGFFQITLGGGKLTFAQAKVIDIVWDIVMIPETLEVGARH
jgi:hypothetical protein